MSVCISQPLSYVRLERYSLGELPASEAQHTLEHLEHCPVCRACYERLQADDRSQQLAALAVALQLAAASRSRPPARRWAAAAVAVAASLACTFFLIQNPKQRSVVSPELEPPSSSKGGALALEVVRLDAQGRQLEPTHFAAGDRFKLLVSCPEGHERALRVLAFQADEVFEPIPAQELASCGNRRALQGAWQLDGAVAVDLCVVFGRFSRGAPLENVRPERLAQLASQLPEPHVCTHLEPVAAEP